jgi:hypothetical protein
MQAAFARRSALETWSELGSLLKEPVRGFACCVLHFRLGLTIWYFLGAAAGSCWLLQGLGLVGFKRGRLVWLLASGL